MTLPAVLSLSVLIISMMTVNCQTPPVLPQQFTTNFSVVFTDFVNNDDQGLFSGFFAFDYKNGGARLEIGGEEFIPIYLHTNFIASPNDTTGEITGFAYEGQICWNGGSVSKTWLVIFPFQLPENSTYVGNQVINGVPCEHWWFNAYDDDYRIDAYITKGNDPVFKRIVLNDIPYSGPVQWDFTNTRSGPFDPKIYSPPDVQFGMKCTTPNFKKSMEVFPKFINFLLNTKFQ